MVLAVIGIVSGAWWCSGPARALVELFYRNVGSVVSRIAMQMAHLDFFAIRLILHSRYPYVVNTGLPASVAIGIRMSHPTSCEKQPDVNLSLKCILDPPDAYLPSDRRAFC